MRNPAWLEGSVVFSSPSVPWGDARPFSLLVPAADVSGKQGPGQDAPASPGCSVWSGAQPCLPAAPLQTVSGMRHVLSSPLSLASLYPQRSPPGAPGSPRWRAGPPGKNVPAHVSSVPGAGVA